MIALELINMVCIHVIKEKWSDILKLLHFFICLLYMHLRLLGVSNRIKERTSIVLFVIFICPFDTL